MNDKEATEIAEKHIAALLESMRKAREQVEAGVVQKIVREYLEEIKEKK